MACNKLDMYCVRPSAQPQKTINKQVCDYPREGESQRGLAIIVYEG